MVNAKDIAGDVTPRRRPGAHDFALVVGIDHYPRFRSLHGAIADATAFHQWACEPDGGGVDAAHARLIVSTPEPAAPVQDQIDEALVDLLETADRLGGGHRLYFYFSGHGAMSPEVSGSDVALLLAKWSDRLARLALSSESYSGTLGSAGLFDELAIFFDCCRSTAAGAIGLPPTITYHASSAGRSTRTFLAYATEAGRSAFERPRSELWQGVFTHCLLTILRQSPRGISASALKDRLECEVAEARAGQQAHVSNALRDDAQFGRRGALPKLQVTCRAGRRAVRLVDGRLGLVAEHDIGSEPWLLELAAGLYKLEDAAGTIAVIEHGRTEVTRVEI
jgi:hypothetical protein